MRRPLPFSQQAARRAGRHGRHGGGRRRPGDLQLWRGAENATRTPMPHAPRPETGRGTRMSESREHPCPKNSTRRMRTHSHAHALLKEDIYGKNLRTDHPGDRNQTAPHPLPRPPIRRSERGLSRGVAAGENPCRRPHHRPYLGTGPGSRHGLGAQPGIRSFADPCNGFQPG